MKQQSTKRGIDYIFAGLKRVFTQLPAETRLASGVWSDAEGRRCLVGHAIHLMGYTGNAPHSHDFTPEAMELTEQLIHFNDCYPSSTIGQLREHIRLLAPYHGFYASLYKAIQDPPQLDEPLVPDKPQEQPATPAPTPEVKQPLGEPELIPT